MPAAHGIGFKLRHGIAFLGQPPWHDSRQHVTSLERHVMAGLATAAQFKCVPQQRTIHSLAFTELQGRVLLSLEGWILNF